jgi:hypothetical protein
MPLWRAPYAVKKFGQNAKAAAARTVPRDGVHANNWRALERTV